MSENHKKNTRKSRYDPVGKTPTSEILLYQTEDGSSRIEVRMQDETVWLSLNQIAELFQRDKSVISKHIRNVFEEGELNPGATVAKFATAQTEGDRKFGNSGTVTEWHIFNAEMNMRIRSDVPNTDE